MDTGQSGGGGLDLLLCITLGDQGGWRGELFTCAAYFGSCCVGLALGVVYCVSLSHFGFDEIVVGSI